jgi:hypothetical protein
MSSSGGSQTGGPVGQLKGYSHDMITEEMESYLPRRKKWRAEQHLFAEAQKGKRQLDKEKHHC